jgi:hypothetical protein
MWNDMTKDTAWSDGCTAWPDSWLGTSHRKCCVAHDAAYAKGAGEGFRDQAGHRLKADWELSRCVAGVKPEAGWLRPLHWFNGGLMFAGVRVGGWRHWHWNGLSGWHWGHRRKK